MPEAPVTREEIENAPIKAKIRAGEEVVKRALEEYDTENTVIGFTGGKDSTLTAWLVKRVCEEHGIEKPRFMFVDHGQHFDELEDYVERLADDWGFEVMIAKNEDLIEKADVAAKITHKNRTEIVMEALREYLEEIEDEEAFKEDVIDLYLDNEISFETLKEFIGRQDAESVRASKTLLDDGEELAEELAELE